MSSSNNKKPQTPEVMPRQTMRGHTGSVICIVHLPRRQCIVTSSEDGSLRLWDLKSGAQIGEEWRDEGKKTAVWRIALSPNGKTVASGSEDGTVRLWDVEKGKVIAKWKEHTSDVGSVCWSPDGERVVSGSLDGTARVWDVESGQTVLTIGTTGHNSEYVNTVIYSPDQSKIATGGHHESAVKIWNAKSGELLATLKHELTVMSLAWTSDEKKLISGSSSGSMRVFDTATWEEIAVLEGHKETVRAFLFRNDRLLVSASSDNTARLWNLDTNLPVGLALQCKEDLTWAAFSTDGKLLVTSCDDKNVYVWDIHAILKEAGLEDLLSIPIVPAGKSLMNSDATRRPLQSKDARRLPPGFFNDGVHSSATRSIHTRSSAHHRALTSSSANPRALLGRLSSLFHPSHSNTGEAIELQRPRQTLFSHRGTHVVEVPAVRDKRALFVAPRPNKAKPTQQQQSQSQGKSQASSSQTQPTSASTSATLPDTTITTAGTRSRPPLWARFVLFLCCASPQYTNGH